MDSQPGEAATAQVQVELGARLHFFRRGVERLKDIEGRHVPILPHRYKREPGGTKATGLPLPGPGEAPDLHL
ncbi:hypothetical protein GCM10023170_069860 [Phytohabitans houttuyneae]|uniref:Uncharacterized protein n=1 Tax=Phytohabitans houttuyneae TaxID=1076126 RepID=A0A6V8K7L5_9ACTN|nr:hypothetical protein Phou_039240 [Phytohabitans houttuyneae]